MLIANFQLFFVWEFQITSAKKIILEEKKGNSGQYSLCEESPGWFIAS